MSIHNGGLPVQPKEAQSRLCNILHLPDGVDQQCDAENCIQVLADLVARIDAIMHRPMPQLAAFMHALEPAGVHRGPWDPPERPDSDDNRIRAAYARSEQHSVPSTAHPDAHIHSPRGHVLAPSDLPLVATLLYVSNPAISLWRGGAVPCTEVARLVLVVAQEPTISLRTFWSLPDALVPPWLKMFHLSCNTMLPMHACALLSSAMVQLRSAEPLHLHPTSTEYESCRMAQQNSVDKRSTESSGTARQFITDVPKVMQPADAHALRAALLSHALLTWLPNASKRQISRQAKRRRAPTASADSVRRVILDVAALARMLDMCVAESSAVSSAATPKLARRILQSAGIDVKSLNVYFVPKNPHSQLSRIRRPGFTGVGAQPECITLVHLNSIAQAARERFGELEELLHRRGGEEDSHICMSGMCRGRPDWQREERLWGLRWLQVRPADQLLSVPHVSPYSAVATTRTLTRAPSPPERDMLGTNSEL